MEDQFKQLGIYHEVYCPFPPYMHEYNIVTDFVQKVEKEKRGESNNFSNIFEWSSKILFYL